MAGADLIIVARGGGSLEDLWAFNEEVVARAIVASRLPVVSAIGHEVDVTIADLAADRRALTPSEAGDLCVPDARRGPQARLDDLADRLARAGRDAPDGRPARGSTTAALGPTALGATSAARRDRLARLAAGLEALSPLAVLARGYSLTFRDGEAAPLRSAATSGPAT